MGKVGLKIKNFSFILYSIAIALRYLWAKHIFSALIIKGIYPLCGIPYYKLKNKATV
jgi:hypothetical protein